MRTVPPTPDGIAVAATAIREGELVVYPTETVYGIGANPFSSEALERLFNAKIRERGNPILVIAADVEQVRGIVAAIPDEAMPFIQAFWPGPLSLLLPRAAHVPDVLTAGSPLLSVRVPGLESARDLCKAVGHAITSTSANISGEPAARSTQEIALNDIAVTIDGGTLPRSAASTVFDPVARKVIRAGAIPVAEIERVAGEPLE